MTGLDELLSWLHGAPLPVEVELKARLLVLDTLGCAVAGLAAPPVAGLAQRLGALDRGPVCLPVCGAALSPLSAASVLATAACWDEACEGLARAHGRPGVAVVAAVLALGIGRSASVGTLLGAVVAGYEVGARLGECLRIRPGMHVDAGWPSLGVAAAAARMLGLDPGRSVAAVELAATQMPFGLYLPIEQGADGRNTYLGHGAWLGSHAALAIASGLAAPVGAVDRHAALALGHDRLVDIGPPGSYLILEGYFKPFAAVRHVHYGAQAALELRARIGQDTSDIEAIELSVYPEAIQYCGNRSPATPIQAQFSLSFGVAAALRFGALGPEVYKHPSFDDAELRRLERLVSIRASEADSGVGGATGAGRSATLALAVRGTRIEHHVDSVAGDPQRPMSTGECVAKFVHNTAVLLGPERARDVAGSILSDDSASPVAGWWDRLVFGESA